MVCLFIFDACLSGLVWDGLPYDNELATNECFGGIITFLQYSSVHIEHAKLKRMDQRLTMGRYPLHWHLVNDQYTSFVRNVVVR